MYNGKDGKEDCRSFGGAYCSHPSPECHLTTLPPHKDNKRTETSRDKPSYIETIKAEESTRLLRSIPEIPAVTEVASK